MKVLFLLVKDGPNYSTVNIAKRLLEKDHVIEIYAEHLEHNNIRMFKDLMKYIKAFSELTEDKIDEFDVIFSTLRVPIQFEKLNKFIFSYNNFYIGDCITQGSDFMFTQCKDRMLDYKENCITMAVGNPKFDNLEKCGLNDKSNRLLFIESGHYPFGSKGRKELAKLVLKICEKFKNYELCIKPRFLPDDKVTTHRNDEHLYSYILTECNNNIPENLIMLKEHTDLNKMIQSSKTVLCAYTSAYIDAAVAGKGLVILDNLPNEDIYELRNARTWKHYKQIMARSGCLVDYHEVLNYLPNGIRFDKNELKERVYSLDDTSEKIVNVMEYMWENFISKNKFPSIKEYDYSNYKEIMNEDLEINLETLKLARVNNFLRSFDSFKYLISADIDYTELYDYIDELYNKYTTYKDEYFNELGFKVFKKRNSILIKNKEKMMKDKIDQSVLFEVMYNEGMIEEILKISENEILCRDFYNYIKAYSEFYNWNFSEAIKYLEFYIEEVEKNPFVKTVADQDKYKVCAYLYAGLSAVKLNDKNKARIFFNKFNNMINCGIDLTDLFLKMCSINMFEDLYRIYDLIIFQKEIYFYFSGIYNFQIENYELAEKYFRKYFQYSTQSGLYKSIHKLDEYRMIAANKITICSAHGK